MPKPRILYCSFHTTLKDNELPALIDAGFEVIPILYHIQAKGWYRFNKEEHDDPTIEINKLWKKHCTLSPEIIDQIQKIDIYRISEKPYSMYSTNLVSNADNKNIDYCGLIDKEDAKLINEYIDIIWMQSFPNAASAVFEWFQGVVLFRLFGNENPNFILWNYYRNYMNTKFIENFTNENRKRYLSIPIFSGLIDHENSPLICDSPIVFNSVVDRAIYKRIGSIKWQKENSSPKVATNISYLDSSPSWREYYFDFVKYFKDTDYLIYGKNDISSPFCQNDNRIKPYIEDFNESLVQYSKLRVFCSISKMTWHSQYTPFENIAMGVPTLFLKNSAIANEALLIFSEKELKDLGMCESLEEMKNLAIKCINDINFAISLSNKQKIILEKSFSYENAKNQAIKIKDAFLKLNTNRNEKNSYSYKIAKSQDQFGINSYVHNTKFIFKKSQTLVCFISNISTRGFNYYKEFIKNFGHFNYKIITNETTNDLAAAKIYDKYISNTTLSDIGLTVDIDKNINLLTYKLISNKIPVLILKESYYGKLISSKGMPINIKEYGIYENIHELVADYEKYLNQNFNCDLLIENQSNILKHLNYPLLYKNFVRELKAEKINLFFTKVKNKFSLQNKFMKLIKRFSMTLKTFKFFIYSFLVMFKLIKDKYGIRTNLIDLMKRLYGE